MTSTQTFTPPSQLLELAHELTQFTEAFADFGNAQAEQLPFEVWLAIFESQVRLKTLADLLHAGQRTRFVTQELRQARQYLDCLEVCIEMSLLNEGPEP